MARSPNPSPTPRQAEYLSFIRAFTDRWNIPPSFEEIGRHFMTTAPSVNNMVKTLEARGFLTRVPGQARTLRVLLPAPPPAVVITSPSDQEVSKTADVKPLTHVAVLIVERLVPALKGLSEPDLERALNAVDEALEIACVEAGASVDARREAHAALQQTALIARGMSPVTRPGRKLPMVAETPLSQRSRSDVDLF